MEKLIRIGYARADITPDAPVPMGGYGNPQARISEQVRDSLFATCIAFTDSNDNTVLLYTTDAIRVDPILAQQVRDVLREEFKLEDKQIMIASTHSHSTPELGMTDFPAIADYRRKYVEGLINAGREAMADRLPAVAYVGTAQTEGVNFIRHYKLADGTYAGANFGNWASGVVGHASNNDPWMQVIKFARIGGRDVLLLNFQAHPCFTGGIDKKVVSADYIGELRKYLEMKTGTRFAFFQGAAGNHNGVSFYARETRTSDAAEYGKLLGDYALRAMEDMRQVKADKVAVANRVLTLPLDHSDDHLVPICLDIQAEWFRTFDRVACNERAREIGQNSIYAVNGVVNRSKMGTEETMSIYAFRVGDLGFACAPYEMFGVSGQHIKEYAPYAMNFVVSCCNDAKAYLASDLAFSHGCYEVDTRRYPRGTAELLADNFVQMLTELR